MRTTYAGLMHFVLLSGDIHADEGQELRRRDYYKEMRAYVQTQAQTQKKSVVVE